MIPKAQTKLKAMGQYYTPSYIVKYIVDQTLGKLLQNYTSDQLYSFPTVLEPACGHGTFLAEALNQFLERYQKTNFNHEIDIGKLHRQVIAFSLYGIDIDPTAINRTIQSIGASFFNANFKVFDAILPPPAFSHDLSADNLLILRNNFKKIFIENKTSDIKIEELKKKICEIENSIKRNLTKKMIENFKFTENNQIIPMPWELIFPETQGIFDVIIGNPPWGSNLTHYSPTFLKSYQTAIKQVDSWSLFLERCIMGLKPGGVLGFIIPNSLLLNENYTSIRKLLLEECSIQQILNLGDNVFSNVTQPSTIIIIKKEKPSSYREIKVIKAISSSTINLLEEELSQLSSLSSVSCSQTRFHRNSEFQFDIFALGFDELRSAVEKDLYDKQIEVKPLRALVTNARGVELNKKGKVYQCSFCGWWNSPPTRYFDKNVKSKRCENIKCKKMVTEHDKIDFIVRDSPEGLKNSEPFLVGYQIGRYYIKGQKYIDIDRKGVNYKSPELYKRKKLLLRKTGYGIKAVIDYNNHWVNQVIYIFKIKKKSLVSLEYILGILNSILISKYFYSKFADPFRKKFPHFTQKRFLEIPIKMPNTLKEKELAYLVERKAIDLQKKYQEKYNLSKEKIAYKSNEKEIDALEKELNELIFKIYGLSSGECDLVKANFISI